MVIVPGRADKPSQHLRGAGHAFHGSSCLLDVRRIGRQPAPAGVDIDKEGCQGLSNLRGDSSRPPGCFDELGHVEDRQPKLLLYCLHQLVCFFFLHIRQRTALANVAVLVNEVGRSWLHCPLPFRHPQQPGATCQVWCPCPNCSVRRRRWAQCRVYRAPHEPRRALRGRWKSARHSPRPPRNVRRRLKDSPDSPGVQ
jgi:hypothetical protein